MPQIDSITYHYYIIYEIYEHGIEVETYPIGVKPSAGKSSPIFVKNPAGRGSSELIKALERLEIELRTLKPMSSRGQRSQEAREYTIYEIQGQEISASVEKEYVKLPPHREFPIIVQIPQGLKYEQIREALGFLKTRQE